MQQAHFSVPVRDIERSDQRRQYELTPEWIDGALAESEARMRAIFDQEFQLVGLLDPDGTVLAVVAERGGRARPEVVFAPAGSPSAGPATAAGSPLASTSEEDA